MTSRELIRWQRMYERRARAGWWTSPWLIAIVVGAALAAFVAWRADEAGPVAASHAWVGGAIVAFAVAYMRVPFHLYWRSDAALLAQLPIEGAALFDSAMLRAIRAAIATTIAVLIGAAPLGVASLAQPLDAQTLVTHHLVFAVVLGATAAFLLPAVATFGAMIVAGDQAAQALRFATALGGAPARGTSPEARGPRPEAPSPPPPVPPGSTALLGALPGFVSSIILALAIVVAPSLHGASSSLPPVIVLGAIGAVSVLAIVGARAAAPNVMGTILRDVSALDRQRLATLEIRPPTAIERAVAGMIGDAGLPYRKDARLMRRRYPMAFALGALVFIVLVIVGLARPDDPTPYLVVVLGGTAMYALSLAGRLGKPPISLRRLEETLPIAASALRRARVAWLVAWTLVYVAVPAVFALVRLRG